MSHFSCLALGPAVLGSAELVLAAARAGGVGLLDLEWCPARSLAAVKGTLDELAGRLRPGEAIGLRLLAEQIDPAIEQGLIAAIKRAPAWVILAGWQPQGLREDLSRLGRDLDLLLEITALNQVQDLDLGLPLAGLLAKGQESGGWCGSESAFILLQGLLRQGHWPVYVQGAIGPYTAAACRAVGASGVVLDDALLQMPESPLLPDQRRLLEGCNGQDSWLLGDQDPNQPRLRVLKRPGWAAAERLRALSEEDPNWRVSGRGLIGWGDPQTHAWPVGQGIGEAMGLRQRYRTTGRLIRAILAQGRQGLSRLSQRSQLKPQGPLAQVLGTRYPIVQGPMTRVSDRPEFALAVAEAGAMPMLALALLEPKRLEPLLAETQAKLGPRPWGVGLLGFAPPELFAAQLACVLRFKPSCALIAGGRPDQARQLEQAGIPTWLHAPTPALARLYIEQGVRRLVFEGRECGGHVGPLGGFALWEGVVAALLELPDPLIAELRLLFAGGIHDRLSTQWIEALCAPLAARGAAIGILIGTAYLLTRESVETGAITPIFQQEAIACRETVTLETGPGHASRCAITPFVATFKERAQRLRAEGRAQTEISQALDEFCLGRLRLAAKGLMRQGPEVLAVDPSTQRQEGLFMIGQVAALCDRVISMSELHRELCEKPLEGVGVAHPNQQRALRVDRGEIRCQPRPSDIAIIGIGLILPRAQSAADFWQNIIDQVPAIAEIPHERWDWRLYYDPDPTARDRVYSKWGCFIDELPFDPARFGIPPKALPAIDPIQLLALEAVRRALADAGYLDTEFDRERTAVIIGASGGLGELGERYVTRAELRRLLSDPEPLLGDLPEWSEDTFPGILLNVAAGRVANRFDLGGANFVVDSACASSLTAVDLAIAQLESGRCHLAIAGGVDTKLSPFGYLCFSKTPALTQSDHACPFDADADGILLGEGVAMVVLKRLSDAEADGDRIYAVIKAAASASDGKALGLTAPRPEGQRRAFSLAYQRAGVEPATLGLYEAHATGTRLGDETEVSSIREFLTAHGAPPAACILGSHKALIGHTKATAGVSGLVKAALALYYRTLPPQPFVKRPLAAFTDPQSPLALLKEPYPWLGSSTPRRAAVSAFGFGGTNCHCVLEEYRDPWREPPPGSSRWPCELILFAAAGQRGLLDLIDRLHQRTAAGSSLIQLASDCAEQFGADPSLPYRAAMVVRNRAELIESLERLRGHLQGRGKSPLPPHLGLSLGGSEAGPLAMLFPGQGSQRVGMGREVALFFEPMRRALERGDRLLRDQLKQPLSWYIWPRRLWDETAIASAEQALTATEIAQPALGCIESGYLSLLEQLGVRPAMLGGHSYGEYMALAAAGVLSAEDLIWLSYQRGQAMAKAAEGAMAAVETKRGLIEGLIAGTGVVLANHNAPDQCVLSGHRADLDSVLGRLQAEGIAVRPLAVSGAFHSPLMATAQAHLDQAIAAVPLKPPRLPVYSNLDGRPYPSDPKDIRAQLARHLLSPVEFVAQIESMYAAGARCFLEVGPRRVLTGLVSRILADRPHQAIAIDDQGGGIRGLLIALGRLFVSGYTLDPRPLFVGRLPTESQGSGHKGPSSKQIFWVSGGGIRRGDQPRSIIQPKPIGWSGTAGAGRLSEATPPAAGDHLDSASLVQSMSNPRPILDPSMSQKTLDNQRGEGPVPSMSQSPNQGPYPDPETLLAVWQAYQETMRKFLEVQERVMTSFLGGQGPGPAEGITEASPQPFQAAGPKLGLGRPVYALNPNPASPDTAISPGVRSVDQMSETRSPKDTDHLATGPSLAQPVEGLVDPGPALTPIDRAGLIAQVTAIISDCTGYPPEMLDPDQGLESELGIDSIKRLEILAGVERILPPELARSMRAQMDRLSRTQTINALVDALLALGPQGEPPGPGGPPGSNRAPFRSTPPNALGPSCPLAGAPDRGVDTGPAASGPSPAAGLRGSVQPLGRYRMAASPAPPLKPSLPPNGQVVVIGEGGLAEQLVGDLNERGLRANPIAPAALGPGSVSQAIAELRRRDGPISGVIQLAGLKAMDLPDDLGTWRAESFAQVKSLFLLLQACAEDLRAQHGRILSASLLGGAFGRNGRCGPGLALAAGNLGMLKTLRFEWPEVRVKAIDLEPLPTEQLVEILRDEFLADDRASEIGYQDGQRLVWEAVPAPFPARLDEPSAIHPKGTGQGSDSASLIQPGPDWVVLALGGARGITAQILRELIVPGMTLIILGRHPPLAEDDPLRGLTESELRAHLIAEARARGEKATPVSIDRRLRQILRAREVASNLAAFRSAGAQVEYHPLDVQDHQAFIALLDRVYQDHGRLDAVLQGVGQIEDRLLIDKPLASFERVFDLKADSTYLLCRYLRPEGLKLVLLFASVSGRSGNRGQCDYATANEVINRLAWWMHRAWPNTRVLSLNWGPWSGTGMASEAVNRQFQARGVIPIDPESGRRFIREELRYGLDEVELILGRFLKPRPLLGYQRPTLDPQGCLRLEYRFDLERDLYLADHRLDGVPVVPAAVALELLAEFVQAGWPEQTLSEVCELRILRGLNLPADQVRAVHLWAQAAPAQGGALGVLAEIRDERGHPYYRATLILGNAPKAGPLPSPLDQGQALDSGRAYAEHCFHGPCFRLLQGSLNLGPQGVDGTLQASDPAIWLAGPGCDEDQLAAQAVRDSSWLIDPGVVDALLQSAILWARLQHKTYPLPSRFGRILRHAEVLPGQVLHFAQRVRCFSGFKLEVDFVVTDDRGQVVLELQGVEAHCDPALNRLAPQPAP